MKNAITIIIAMDILITSRDVYPKNWLCKKSGITKAIFLSKGEHNIHDQLSPLSANYINYSFFNASNCNTYRG